MAVTAMLVFVVAAFILNAATFLTSYALAQVTRSLKSPEKPQNPFIHEGAYPPQTIPRGAHGSSSDQI